MTLMILGLKEAPWEEFAAYMGKDEATWKAAVSCATPEQLERALFELELGPEKLIEIAGSFGKRFANSSPTSYYYGPETLGGYSDSRMSAKEFERAVSLVIVFTAFDDDSVRCAFYKALASSATSIPERASPEAVSTLSIGLEDKPGIAIACANAFKEMESQLYLGKHKETVIPDLVNALSRPELQVVEACADTLGLIGHDRGHSSPFGDIVLPAIKRRADELMASGKSALVGKLLDAIDRIEFGLERSDVEYRQYMGGGETLRVPMFTSRPVPTTKPTKDVTGKNINRQGSL